MKPPKNANTLKYGNNSKSKKEYHAQHTITIVAGQCFVILHLDLSCVFNTYHLDHINTLILSIFLVEETKMG